MASAADRNDPLKEYWWVLLLAVLFVGGWLSLSSPSSTGGDSVQLAAQSETASEQSLRSLDAAANPQGAPGGALAMPGDAKDGSGASAKDGADGAASSLYQAPGGAAGSPIPEGAGAAIEAAAKGQVAGGAGSLAEALKSVAASSGKAPDNSWGGASARSGFSKPRAEFGAVGTSRSGGGGSTNASLVVVEKAFGTGGNVALNLGPSGAGADAKGRIAAGMGKGPGLEGLKSAQKASLDMLNKGEESAASRGRQSFDGGAAGRGALSQLQATQAAGGSGVAGDEGVPMNLKATDPNQIDKKKIEPPPLDGGKEQVDTNNQQYMQQQMMMMMMGMVMMGVMGPAGGQMASMMMPMMQMGMMMNQQQPPQSHNVGSSFRR